MNKIEVLKQHNQLLGLSFIDVVKQAYPRNKYAELIVNLTKAYYKNKIENEEIKLHIHKTYSISIEQLENMSSYDLRYFTTMLDFIPYQIREMMPKFVDYVERGLIENKDLTSYKGIEDMLRQISIAELKSVNKELAKQVHKIYEDEEWLVLRPLSREASLKYGAGTKWCTASTEDDWPYYRYTRRGILVYTMSKKTGQKVAAFKNIDPNHEHELSFWNEVDTRIDSYEADLPKFIMEIIFNELKSTLTNEDMTPEECKYKDLGLKSEPMPEPVNELIAIPRTIYASTYDNEIAINNTVSVTLARTALEQEIINHLQDEQH